MKRVYMEMIEYPHVLMVIRVKRRVVIVNRAAREGAYLIQLDFED